MATYKVLDLIQRLREILFEGYEYADVREIPADDNFPVSLSFSALDEDEDIDFEEVESCSIPDNYNYQSYTETRSSDSPCEELTFTYNELLAIRHALDNAIENCNTALKDPSISRDIQQDIKTSIIDFRNLQAKLAKLFKHIRF